MLGAKVRQTEQYYFFWKHQFGQWTRRDIQDPDGVTYNCCEQYMMVKKALLFGDKDMAQRLLSEPEPKEQQLLGRQIKGFDADIWDKHKVGIVWYGNYLKFTQHKDLQDRLLATGDRVLAEASPYDQVWGVGLGANDDAILDPGNWTGQNLLGEVLMSVRGAVRLVSSSSS